MFNDLLIKFASSVTSYAPGTSGVIFAPAAGEILPIRILNNLKAIGVSGFGAFFGFLGVIAAIYLVWLLFAKLRKNNRGDDVSWDRILGVAIFVIASFSITTFEIFQSYMSNGGKEIFDTVLK